MEIFKCQYLRALDMPAASLRLVVRTDVTYERAYIRHLHFTTSSFSSSSSPRVSLLTMLRVLIETFNSFLRHFEHVCRGLNTLHFRQMAFHFCEITNREILICFNTIARLEIAPW